VTHPLRKFLLRLVAATAVVFATYNPTGLSYVGWVREGFDPNLALKVMIGLVFFLAWVVLLRATFFSIGAVGAGLVAALVATVVWVLVDSGLLNLESPGVLAWVSLLAVSIVLGVGLSWAIIRRRLSGQVSVDDVEQ
jgi:ABC-type uncharacterized transport system permease subunit